MVVKPNKHDGNGIVVAGSLLPSPQVSWIVPAKRNVAFDETSALERSEGDDGEEHLPPWDDVIEDIIDVDADAEDDSELRDFLHFG